jgi:HEAT repeat protein
MLRSSRIVARLAYALSLTAYSVTTVAVATSVVGCKDESQPDYWVDKLQERAWQANAVKRLEQFFEDTYTRANKDLASDEMKKLADKIIEPLTKLYVDNYSDLDDKTRESVIKLIASFRDKRGEPALKKAFEEFAAKGKGEDVKWAARAAADLKLEGIQDSMLKAYDKLKAATKDGMAVYRDLNEAMVRFPSAAWAGTLTAKLDGEIVRPADAKSPEMVDKFKNELFWQTAAAQVLGELKSEAAVEPLLKVMLDPAKGDVQTTAVLALVKIGKPAVAKTVKLLMDQDPNLSAYALAREQKLSGSKELPKGKPYIATAALVLGVMGRPETLEPMIAALKDAKDEGNRAVIAREIAKIPPTPASKQAFKDAYETLTLEASIPPGANALAVLTESASTFYDSDFVPWLIDRSEKFEKAKGNDEEKKGLRSTATLTVIKLMKADQIPAVGVAVEKWGTQIEKDAFKQASELLKACTDRVSCYLANLEKGENQEKSRQFVGFKAAYMIGEYGDEKARGEIIDRLDRIDNAAVRFVSGQTIDFLSPRGSKEAADALDKIIDKNAKTADKDKIAGDAPLKQVMYRVRARAE